MSFLSLDVEGAELEVLRGINHKIFRFDYILAESRSFKEMSEYLELHNYIFKEELSHHDYLFANATNT